jgi:DNA-binding response OmpR family regulator
LTAIFHAFKTHEHWLVIRLGGGMILIIEDRNGVADAYRTSFQREGIAACGFSAVDFESWLSGAADDDLSAIQAVLIGECSHIKALAQLFHRRNTAAVIAMRDEKSLSNTLELFANGFDDVVTKPCHVKEILARIEAVSRRRRAETPSGAEDEIRIFRDGRDPLVGGEPLRLPRRELRILEFLVASNSRRVTKAQIFNSVYGLFTQEIEETVIECHISRLRRRLRTRLGYDPIDSYRHLGYRLVCRTVVSSGKAAVPEKPMDCAV